MTTFQVPYGLSYRGNAGPQGTCLMQEAGGFLYIFTAGRTWVNNYSSSQAPISQIVKWDGTPNPGPSNITYFPVLAAGKNLECWGTDNYFDSTNNHWHIFYYNDMNTSVSHIAWDCVNDRLLSYGAIYSMTQGSQVFGCGNIIGYVPDEQSAIITGTDFDAVNQIMTITYNLYSNDGSPANVAIDFNDTVNPWQSATRYGAAGEGLTSLTTSVSGSAHTYVHDTYFDLGFFDGSVQYRITPL